MTYHVTALTNDRARLIVKEAQTTCEATAKLIHVEWSTQGYVVVRRTEG